MSENSAQYIQLAERIIAGDADAETELWSRVKNAVFHIVFPIVRDYHLAEDLTQETYLIVLGEIKKGHVRELEKLWAFVAQVARFNAIERIRDLRRKGTEELGVAERVSDPAPNQQKLLETAEANLEIRSLIEKLAPRDREVITRLYLNEEPKERICANLGLTRTQFDRIVHRARQRYRELYLKHAVSFRDDVDESVADGEVIPVAQEVIAVAQFGNQLRLILIAADGTTRWLDQAHNLHNVIYIHSSETNAFAQAIEELEDLMNDPKSKENAFQDFFERNPEFILNDDYKKAHPHVVLTKDDGSELIPDFLLEPLDQGALCDILELKLPSARAFVLKKSRMRFSSAVAEACAQLREYSRFFDEDRNRQAIKDRYGLMSYKPRMFVIIGRRGKVDPLALRDMQSDMSSLDLKTYDDIVERAKARAERMKRGGLRN